MRVIPAIVALLVAIGPSKAGAQNLAPFNAIVFVDRQGASLEYPMILLDGEWVGWLSMGGIAFDAIENAARERYGGDWQRRVREDLPDVLERLAVDIRPTVKLGVIRPDGSRQVVETTMTRDKRRAAYIAFHQQRLTPWGPVTVETALGELVRLVRERHAYATLRGLDLDALAVECAAGVDAGDLDAIRDAIQRFVSALGDGHAAAVGWRGSLLGQRSPILLGHTDQGVIAFTEQRELVDAERPYAVAIDGAPIEAWIDAASPWVAAGSPQLVRRRSIELLRYIDWARRKRGFEIRPMVSYTLAGDGGINPRAVRFDTCDRRAIYGTWPRDRRSCVLDAGFGYLRLESMSPSGDDVIAIADLLPALLDTPGLIIDVRGNGGGSRSLLRWLLPIFMTKGDGPRVLNVARPRLWDDRIDHDDLLEDRFLYTASWPGWTDRERDAIERFKGIFKPGWQVPDEGYGRWRYMVVTRRPEDPSYDRPVVLLMDSACFSATDIFLGAFGVLPNVTLMGEPSSGGSARSLRHRLGASGMDVRLASMASFDPDGHLYDTHGVLPDIHVPAGVTDLVGDTDTQLDAVVAWLTERTQH